MIISSMQYKFEQDTRTFFEVISQQGKIIDVKNLKKSAIFSVIMELLPELVMHYWLSENSNMHSKSEQDTLKTFEVIMPTR